MSDQTSRSSPQIEGIAEVLCRKGYELLKQGELALAANAFHEALKVRPNFVEAHLGLASAKMPGEDYRMILRRFHRWISPARYMEIGVEDGESLALARLSALAVGIDPAPQITFDLGPNTQIFAVTSDLFFSTVDVQTLLGGTLDLALIDGLHLFEQTLRDFINVEKHSRPSSVVLVHDTLPLDQATATRERRTQFWSGDVWKIVPCLRAFRKDLRLLNIATSPTGLLAVTNLNPDSGILEEHYDRILAEFLPLEFEDIGARRYLEDVTANDWDLIQERLQSEK